MVYYKWDIHSMTNNYGAAYTKYAFLEWSLILFDVGYDAITALDFAGFELQVVDIRRNGKGYVSWLPL